MSWVPILGSALGSLLGGLLSDFLIQRQKQATRRRRLAADEQRKEASIGKSSNYSRSLGSGFAAALSLHSIQRKQELAAEAGATGQYEAAPPCSPGSDRLSYFGTEDRLSLQPQMHLQSSSVSSFSSVSSPRVIDMTQSLLADHSLHGVAPTNAAAVVSPRGGGDDGAGIIGGSELPQGAAPAEEERTDQSPRLLIAAISNVLSLPLVIASLFLEYPYCFVIFIPSGMVSVACQDIYFDCSCCCSGLVVFNVCGVDAYCMYLLLLRFVLRGLRAGG